VPRLGYTHVAARHLQLDQIVAPKFLRPEALANPEALDRFMREARNAARLRSEHVARIIDVDTLDSGAPYIIMARRGPLLARAGPWRAA
jgi:serine/threonine-protein kinase